MLFKSIIALTLAAVAASQRLDNCTISLTFQASSQTNDFAETVSCVFPELSHEHCLARYRSLRVAFKAPHIGEETTTCNYAVNSSPQISVTDFLNIPAVCSMLGGKMAFANFSECIRPE
jgi:hypothetical protein